MTMHHAMLLEADRMLIFNPIYYKKTKMGLILADKIKIKNFIKENQNLKTSKLINASKHVLIIEIGPQNLRRLKKTSLESRFEMQNQSEI